MYPMYPCIHVSMYPCIHVSIHRSIHLSIYPSILLSYLLSYLILSYLILSYLIYLTRKRRIARKAKLKSTGMDLSRFWWIVLLSKSPNFGVACCTGIFYDLRNSLATAIKICQKQCSWCDFSGVMCLCELSRHPSSYGHWMRFLAQDVRSSTLRFSSFVRRVVVGGTFLLFLRMGWDTVPSTFPSLNTCAYWVLENRSLTFAFWDKFRINIQIFLVNIGICNKSNFCGGFKQHVWLQSISKHVELTSKHQHSVPGVDSKSRADVEEPGSNRQLIWCFLKIV